MMKEEAPKPKSNGRCSSDCPLFTTDRMPGWPSFDVCCVWDEKLDGKEPYYLADDAICMPKFRLPEPPAE